MTEHDSTMRVALRVHALPSYAGAGWMQLRISQAPVQGKQPPAASSPEQQRAGSRGSNASRRGFRNYRGEGAFGFVKKPTGEPDTLHSRLLGSFAAGPQSIWREVPANSERPAYYYNEEYGVSQWHRPRIPGPRDVQLEGVDLQERSPRFQSLDPQEQFSLMLGELPARPPREPALARLIA